MKNKPPLPLEATPSCRQKHKKIKNTKSRNLGNTSRTPPKSDQSESSFPLSTELEITSTFDGESDTIEIEALETLFTESYFTS